MKAGKKHPIRGFFAGLLLGLAVAQLLVVFKVLVFGDAAMWIVVVVLTVVGALWSLMGPTRARKGSKAAAKA